MVRKMIVVLMALAALAAVPLGASATSYTPYDGSISSTYIQVFRDVAHKINIFDDYVFFRAGENEYILVAGDLEYDDVVFTGASCTMYRLAGDAAYIQEEITDFSLEPGITLVYSSLGPFPDLIDGSQRYTFSVLLLCLVALCMVLIRPVFKFSLRWR